MPKRKHQETKEERWLRKMKKYEERLDKNRRSNTRRRVIYSDDESDEAASPVQEEIQSDEPIGPVIDDLPTQNASIPNTVVGVADTAEPCAAPNAATAAAAAAAPSLEADCGSSNAASAGVSAESSTTHNYDPDLLRELGEAEIDPVEYGDDIQPDLASRFQKILLSGLAKEAKEELLKKYIFPKNVLLSKGPTLNPEIGAMLVETCKQRDKRLLAKQDQLGKALSALGKAMSSLLKKNPDIPDVIRTLNDATKLLADSHYLETDTRRSVIIPLIDKSLSDPFKDRKRDKFLFGEKLGDLVKDSRGIKKTGQLIQASTSSSSSNLNTKSSSSRGRQQRGGQTSQYRAGGQKYLGKPYPSRRRAAAPPPPPPSARRQPAPPPPARRQPATTQRAPTSRTS